MLKRGNHSVTHVWLRLEDFKSLFNKSTELWDGMETQLLTDESWNQMYKRSCGFIRYNTWTTGFYFTYWPLTLWFMSHFSAVDEDSAQLWIVWLTSARTSLFYVKVFVGCCGCIQGRLAGWILIWEHLCFSKYLWVSTVTLSVTLCFQQKAVNSVCSFAFYHFIKLHKDNLVRIMYYLFTSK